MSKLPTKEEEEKIVKNALRLSPINVSFLSSLPSITPDLDQMEKEMIIMEKLVTRLEDILGIKGDDLDDHLEESPSRTDLPSKEDAISSGKSNPKKKVGKTILEGDKVAPETKDKPLSKERSSTRNRVKLSDDIPEEEPQAVSSNKQDRSSGPSFTTKQADNPVSRKARLEDPGSGSFSSNEIKKLGGSLEYRKPKFTTKAPLPLNLDKTTGFSNSSSDCFINSALQAIRPFITDPNVGGDPGNIEKYVWDAYQYPLELGKISPSLRSIVGFDETTQEDSAEFLIKLMVEMVREGKYTIFEQILPHRRFYENKRIVYNRGEISKIIQTLGKDENFTLTNVEGKSEVTKSMEQLSKDLVSPSSLSRSIYFIFDIDPIDDEKAFMRCFRETLLNVYRDKPGNDPKDGFNCTLQLLTELDQEALVLEINHDVSSPVPGFDIPEVINLKHNYRLRSMVIHVSSDLSPSSGHYVAVVRYDNKIAVCDDIRTSEVDYIEGKPFDYYFPTSESVFRRVRLLVYGKF